MGKNLATKFCEWCAEVFSFSISTPHAPELIRQYVEEELRGVSYTPSEEYTYSIEINSTIHSLQAKIRILVQGADAAEYLRHVKGHSELGYSFLSEIRAYKSILTILLRWQEENATTKGDTDSVPRHQAATWLLTLDMYNTVLSPTLAVRIREFFDSASRILRGGIIRAVLSEEDSLIDRFEAEIQASNRRLCTEPPGDERFTLTNREVLNARIAACDSAIETALLKQDRPFLRYALRMREHYEQYHKTLY